MPARSGYVSIPTLRYKHFCTMTSFRQQVYLHLLGLLDSKLSDMQRHCDELRESLKLETKSTAGDKYETGRAMVHIEQENADRQLSALQEQKAALEHLAAPSQKSAVAPGSLVATSQGYFFISIPLGKSIVDSHTVYALSPSSPLGQKLMGQPAGAEVTLNGKRYTILAIE